MKGKYEIVRILKKGGFGCAQLVKSKSTNTLYVIKEIELDQSLEDENKSVLQEVKILDVLRHPNIIGFVDYFLVDNKLQIVMEYAAKGDLQDLINKQHGKLFSEEQIIEWFYSTCKALTLCHQKNILHRDIKPLNIFLMEDGTVKLGDFGIARILSKSSSFATTKIGTISYFSPELFEDDSYSKPSDIWALGVTLYQLCALKMPFEGKTDAAIMRSILMKDPTPIPSSFSPKLNELILLMLQKEPNDRPIISTILQHPVFKLAMINCPFFVALGIDPKSFSPQWNKDFGNSTFSEGLIRGGLPYYPPKGWMRFGLDVTNKYNDGNDAWLSKNGSEGEWAVAYHGTTYSNVKSITTSPLHSGPCNAYGKGIYCNPKVDHSEGYSQPILVWPPEGEKRYRFVFMCRVNVRRIHKCSKGFCPLAEDPDYSLHLTCDSDIWFTNQNNSNYEVIRPYGLLVKELKE